MKRYFIIVLFFFSCNLQSTHEVRYSPDGKDSIAFMRYFDGKQYNEVYMAYGVFEDLHSQGGYDSVYNYYRTHDLPEFWMKKFKTYKKH